MMLCRLSCLLSLCAAWFFFSQQGVTIEERNLIQWVKVIAPGQTEVFSISYTVDYPKDKQVEYTW